MWTLGEPWKGPHARGAAPDQPRPAAAAAALAAVAAAVTRPPHARPARRACRVQAEPPTATTATCLRPPPILPPRPPLPNPPTHPKEDGELTISLTKLQPGEPWPAAIKGHEPDALTQQQEQQRLMLERFQREVRGATAEGAGSGEGLGAHRAFAGQLAHAAWRPSFGPACAPLSRAVSIGLACGARRQPRRLNCSASSAGAVRAPRSPARTALLPHPPIPTSGPNPPNPLTPPPPSVQHPGFDFSQATFNGEVPNPRTFLGGMGGS